MYLFGSDLLDALFKTLISRSVSANICIKTVNDKQFLTHRNVLGLYSSGLSPVKLSVCHNKFLYSKINFGTHNVMIILYTELSNRKKKKM